MRISDWSSDVCSSDLWSALRDSLIQSGRLRRNGPWLHLPGHAATLAPQEAELAQRLLPLIHAGAFDPPWVRDLASGQNETEQALRLLLLKLMRRGELYQVVRHLFLHRELVATQCGMPKSVGGPQ